MTVFADILRTRRGQQGYSLVEVMVAVALLGIVAVAVFTGLRGSTSALITADQRATAESIARSQMEYVKNLPFSSGNYTAAAIPSEYVGFTVNGYPYNGRISPVAINDASGNPRVGVQKISITVFHDGNQILTLEDYKAR